MSNKVGGQVSEDFHQILEHEKEKPKQQGCQKKT